MKKNILWIFIAALTVAITCINIFIWMKQYTETIKENSKKTVIWKSFKRETYNKENFLIDYSENANYILETNNQKIKICTITPDTCDESEYRKINNKYELVTKNPKIINANIQIKENPEDKVIYIIKTHNEEEAQYSVFYFKKEESK